MDRVTTPAALPSLDAGARRGAPRSAGLPSILVLLVSTGCAVQHTTPADSGSDADSGWRSDGSVPRDSADVRDASAPDCARGEVVHLIPDTVPWTATIPLATVVDPRGPVVLWSSGSAIYAGRPRMPSVSLGDGQAVAAMASPEGILTCVWGTLDASSGECTRLGVDLRSTVPPWSVSYERALRFDRVGGQLHVVYQRERHLRPRELVIRPVDDDGRATGDAVPVPCTDAAIHRLAPTERGWVCLDAPTCTDDRCASRARFFDPEGNLTADHSLPDVGPPNGGLALASRGGAALAVWRDAGIRTLPFASGEVGSPAMLPTASWGSWLRVWPLGSGYLVGYHSRGSGFSWRARHVDGRGRPLGPELGAGLDDPSHYPLAVAQVDSEWTLFTFERHAPSTWRYFATTMGCIPEGCHGGYVRCVDGDGSTACVDPSAERCHCGGCGVECAFACVDGVCVDECEDGAACGTAGTCESWSDPLVECVDPLTDERHCGACGAACETGLSCVEGACCTARETSCGGAVDTDCDGRRGCDDCDCAASTPGCGFATSGVELDCTNGVSDDTDPDVDCDDVDCVSDVACGGPGRCAMVDLGSRVPVRHTGLFAVLADSTTASCAPAGTREHTVRWTAPSTGTYRFRSAFSDVAVFDGSCSGAELACAANEVTLPLAGGQPIVVALEGSDGCAQLDVDEVSMD